MTTQAAIIAQTPSYLSTASDGSRALDIEALRAWVTGQIQATINLTAPADSAYNNYLRGAVASAISPALDRLASTVAVSNWSARPDWPLNSTSQQREIGSTRTHAVASAIANVNDAAKRITANYEAINVALANRVRTQLFDEVFAPLLPTPIERVVDARFYVTTLVTDWGEESAPSPVSDMLEVDANDVLVIPVPVATAGRGVNRWRLYRSNSGNDTTAFQFVAENLLTTPNYTDSQKSAELKEALPTTTWLQPPAQLRGLVGMPNGIMAGFYDNVLCFCEPYAPYAWPVQYQLTTKSPIVGLAAFGQTLFVGTRGLPYLVSGSDSASMSAQELPGSQACASAASMAAVENGVLYASPDGICLGSGNGVELVTQHLFTRADWQALVPASMVGAYHDGAYYFFYNTGTRSGCYALDFVTKKINQVSASGTALFADGVTDTLYLAHGTAISALFSGAVARTALYRTGIIHLTQPQPMGWLQCDSDFSSPVTVRWFGDGVLRHTATLTSLAPVRLPPGRYQEQEVEIETSARITSLTLAGSTQALQAV